MGEVHVLTMDLTDAYGDEVISAQRSFVFLPLNALFIIDVIGLVDTSGNLVVEYKYNAWGNILGTCTLTILYSTLASMNPFRYRGYNAYPHLNKLKERKK